MPDRNVLFGVGLGAWNGADTVTAAETANLTAQADRDGLDLFTVADHPYFGAKLADGWIPPMASDWQSQLYRDSRPRIDDAAAAAGRDPAEVATVYNFGGRITAEPLAATRGEDGRWIGGSVQQWVDELTTAVLVHHASGFIYRSTDDTPAAEALARWATQIVPAVRDAIAK